MPLTTNQTLCVGGIAHLNISKIGFSAKSNEYKQIIAKIKISISHEMEMEDVRSGRDRSLHTFQPRLPSAAPDAGQLPVLPFTTRHYICHLFPFKQPPSARDFFPFPIIEAGLRTYPEPHPRVTGKSISKHGRRRPRLPPSAGALAALRRDNRYAQAPINPDPMSQV